eukprot:1812765-Rhodomonas_salina.2
MPGTDLACLASVPRARQAVPGADLAVRCVARCREMLGQLVQPDPGALPISRCPPATPCPVPASLSSHASATPCLVLTSSSSYSLRHTRD